MGIAATRENQRTHINNRSRNYIGNFTDSLSDDIKTITWAHTVDE